MSIKVLDQAVEDRFAAYNGDSCEVLRVIPDASVGYIIYSPPFSSLFVYSASERDCGNVRDDEEFFAHFEFIVRELYRVLKPGRLMSVHCMLMPTSKSRDGYIGLRDFRGDLIRAFQAAGFIFHSETAIWKDPVTAMQRTKALGLLHKQIRKDSSMSRQGINDYLVTMRKPGENEERIEHTHETFPVALWQRYASPVWATLDSPPDLHSVRLDFENAISRACSATDEAGNVFSADERLARVTSFLRERAAVLDDSDFYPVNAREADDDDSSGINPSNTLQRASARDEEDERHIAPLQLSVIRRGIRLWSNPGDVVLTPFGGIGSEGYVALQEGRKALLCELKCSYFAQLVKNLRAITNAPRQQTMF